MPHKCDVCGKAFSEKSSLTKHHRLHTGKKPYKCDVCRKAFSDMDQLAKHDITPTGKKSFTSVMYVGKHLLKLVI